MPAGHEDLVKSPWLLKSLRYSLRQARPQMQASCTSPQHSCIGCPGTYKC